MPVEGHGEGVVDEGDEVGVAHAGGVAPVGDAVDGCLEVERAVGQHRDHLRRKHDEAHVGFGVVDLAVLAAAADRHLPPAGGGVDHEAVIGAEAELGGHVGQAAQTVAADLGQPAVGVGQLHLAVGAVAPPEQADEPVGADPAAPVAERGPERRRQPVAPPGAEARLEIDQHEEVVAGGVELREVECGHRSPD